jgi:uncharacterized protein DUF4159
MRCRTYVIAAVLALISISGVHAFQKPFREYQALEYYGFPKPPDWQEKTEWVFGRLIYPAVVNYPRWTMDYPRSDRHFASALRRLTRVQARSVEQPINLDDADDVYNWPWLYGVEVGYWDLSDQECRKLRDYLLRGGFFMCDDFHGTREWQNFTLSMNRVFPDRPIVEIDNKDAIFHTIFDLDDRYQVPGAIFLRTHRTFEQDGIEPRWRGIYDDKGRLMVAICHNMDLGDSWEHADNPLYPERFSALGFRIGVNYVIYSMTH